MNHNEHVYPYYRRILLARGWKYVAVAPKLNKFLLENAIDLQVYKNGQLEVCRNTLSGLFCQNSTQRTELSYL